VHQLLPRRCAARNERLTPALPTVPDMRILRSGMVGGRHYSRSQVLPSLDASCIMHGG